MAFFNTATLPAIPGQRKRGIIFLILLAIGAVMASFLWQGRMGISTGDEGFLWYGAQRVLLGEVPLRDFWSYDPGRYYWVAMVMTLLGDNGIIPLRIAGAIFQAMGLFLGIWLIDRSILKRNWFFLSVSTLTLLFWMFPWFKQYDIALSIALIGVLSFMIEQPTRQRYFLTGLFIGLIASFSRYQGISGILGNFGVMVYLALKRESGPKLIKGFVIWSVGVLTGYIPTLIMFALVPGYAQALFEDYRVWLFEMKGLTLTMPVPWPWLVPFGQISLGGGIRWILSGLFFLAPIIYGICGIAWATRQKLYHKTISSVLVATAFLSLPYAGYVFVNPDISRLGLGLFPFLIGALIILGNMASKLKWPLVALLCGATLLVMLPNHPGWSWKRYVSAEVGGTRLKIYPDSANFFAMLTKLDHEYAPGGRTFIAVPRFTTAFAFLKRKNPMYETSSIFPRNDDFQQAEIERIKAANPGFAIIYDKPAFGSDMLHFSKTHPKIFQYIVDHFDPLPLSDYTDDPAYLLYKAKSAAALFEKPKES